MCVCVCVFVCVCALWPAPPLARLCACAPGTTTSGVVRCTPPTLFDAHLPHCLMHSLPHFSVHTLARALVFTLLVLHGHGPAPCLRHTVGCLRHTVGSPRLSHHHAMRHRERCCSGLGLFVTWDWSLPGIVRCTLSGVCSRHAHPACAARSPRPHTATSTWGLRALTCTNAHFAYVH